MHTCVFSSHQHLHYQHLGELASSPTLLRSWKSICSNVSWKSNVSWLLFCPNVPFFLMIVARALFIPPSLLHLPSPPLSRGLFCCLSSYYPLPHHHDMVPTTASPWVSSLLIPSRKLWASPFYVGYNLTEQLLWQFSFLVYSKQCTTGPGGPHIFQTKIKDSSQKQTAWRLCSDTKVWYMYFIL